jgi:hypothetical protein
MKAFKTREAMFSPYKETAIMYKPMDRKDLEEVLRKEGLTLQKGCLGLRLGFFNPQILDQFYGMIDHFSRSAEEKKGTPDSPTITGVQQGYAGSAQFYATGDASQAQPQVAVEVKSLEQKTDSNNSNSNNSNVMTANSTGPQQSMQVTVPQGAVVSANTVDTGMGEGVVVSVQPQTVPVRNEPNSGVLDNQVPVQVSDVKMEVSGTSTQEGQSPSQGQVIVQQPNSNNSQMMMMQNNSQNPNQVQITVNQQGMMGMNQQQQMQMGMGMPMMNQMGMMQPMMQPLPPGWSMAQDAQGRVFYLNHQTQTTQWNPPTM